MQLKDCPADILLYLLGYLGLIDAVHFLSTCTRLRRLSDNRSLWIQILQRTQSDGSQPLACPPQTDLSQLNLPDLQQIAHHTFRLEKNWSSENPSNTGAGTTIEFHEIRGPFSILVVIPGTHILVLNYAEKIFCYDFESETSWPCQSIGKIRGHAQFAEYRKHFIAVVHQKDDIHFLEVFCVEYGPSAPLIPQKVYSNTLPDPVFFRTVFMQDAIVGIIHSDPEYYLTAFNIYTNASITILLPHVLHGLIDYPHSSCLVQGSSVYIVLQQVETCICRLYVCDTSTPWDNDNMDGRFNPSPFATFDTVPETLRFFTYPLRCQVLHPIGLAVINATIANVNLDQPTIHILFHPDIFTSFHPSDTLQMVLRGQPHEKEPNVFSTHAGNFILVCITSSSDNNSLEGTKTRLHTIRFVKGPPASIQVRRLPVPFFIMSKLEADQIHSIAFDDHLGVLYLTSTRGIIYAVPFA